MLRIASFSTALEADQSGCLTSTLSMSFTIHFNRPHVRERFSGVDFKGSTSMKLVLEGQPTLVHLGVWICVVGLIVSFVGILCGIYLTLTKTGALITKRNEVNLSYWERAARKNSRAGDIFIAPHLRSLRYLLFTSTLAFFGLFGILSAIIGIFGERN
jgi:hypothetical protein